MDVHPTKNVSIGIDPYPYGGFVGSIQLSASRIGLGLAACLRREIGGLSPTSGLKWWQKVLSLRYMIFDHCTLVVRKKADHHDPT